MTRTGDKVQVMRAVAAMQAAGHGKSYGIGCTDTRPCKKRKDGAPRFQNGKGKTDGQCGEARRTREQSGFLDRHAAGCAST
jgi:hypothetical protein